MLTNVKRTLNDVYESVGSYRNRTFNKLSCVFHPLSLLLEEFGLGLHFKREVCSS